MRTTEPHNHMASGSSSLGDAAVEIVPIISTVFAAGPPVLLMWVGLVVFALLLAGPFLLFVTIVIALVALAGLVVAAGAILASPFLVIRHFHRRAAQREHTADGWSPVAVTAGS
jgi:Cu/Ag efflux pump CusA